MTNRIIYKGLIIESGCKYFYIHPDNKRSKVEFKDRDLLEITYIPGDTTFQLSELLGIPVVGGSKILGKGMGIPEKFPCTYITLNGLKLRKLTYDPHIVRIVIVGDNDSRVCQDYGWTTLIINKDDYKNPNFLHYLI